MIGFPGFLRISHHDWWHIPVIILVPSWTNAWLDDFIHSIITDTEWDGQNEFMIENYFSKSTLHLKEMFQDSQLTFLTLLDYLVLIVCTFGIGWLEPESSSCHKYCHCRRSGYSYILARFSHSHNLFHYLFLLNPRWCFFLLFYLYRRWKTILFCVTVSIVVNALNLDQWIILIGTGYLKYFYSYVSLVSLQWISDWSVF